MIILLPQNMHLMEFLCLGNLAGTGNRVMSVDF